MINKRKKMFHSECLKFTKNRYSMYSRERERKKKASTIKALQYSQNYLYEWENVSKQRHLLLYLCERFFSLSMAPALFNIALKKRIVYSTSGKRFFPHSLQFFKISFYAQCNVYVFHCLDFCELPKRANSKCFSHSWSQIFLFLLFICN